MSFTMRATISAVRRAVLLGVKIHYDAQNTMQQRVGVRQNSQSRHECAGALSNIAVLRARIETKTVEGIGSYSWVWWVL